MLVNEQSQFPPQTVSLRDGRAVSLRFLSVDDAEKMGDFYESIERAAYRFYCPHPLTREWARKRSSMALAPTSVYLVAEYEAQQIVGYASYQWKPDSDEPSIFGICVRSTYRGVSLGRALMMRLFKVAKYIGPQVMSLTVQEANPRAFALYSSMGFEVIREQMRKQVEEFPPEPEYYMERLAR